MANLDEALAITREALRRHLPEGRSVEASDHIQNDLGLDSLAVMELISEIEDQLDVTIPNEALADLSTVADVAEALSRLEPGSAMTLE